MSQSRDALSAFAWPVVEPLPPDKPRGVRPVDDRQGNPTPATSPNQVARSQAAAIQLPWPASRSALTWKATMIEGGCNCGAIRYRIEGTPLGVAACHCSRCRRQSGSVYSVNLMVHPSTMSIDGRCSVFEDTDTTSGLPVYREFCPVCGSPIRSIIGANPEMIAVKVGTLDDPTPFAPGLHVYTRSRIAWVEVPAGAPQFDSVPI